MDFERIHRLLMAPSSYPEKPSAVEFRETHISRVYMLDEHVYKMKKPLNFGFFDFSTLEKRRFFCVEEVRLNSRFSPDTYLGVIPICQEGDQIHLGPPGEAIEYLVRMRRLPEDRMLNRMLDGRAANLSSLMAKLGRHLAGLHLAEPACNHDEGYSDLMHVRRNWDENLRQMEPFIGKTISAEGFAGLSRYVKDFLEINDGLIDCREKAGWVRECHGDLHAEHVVMTEPIRIYDCIEFNRRFRVSDILADIAFLLMDIDRHGRPELSQILWQEYHKALPDEVPEGLLRFYKIYRACVRGKVASFLSAEHEAGSDQNTAAMKEAFSYFNLALGYLQPRTLIITCGLMGSGKTSLATELAAALRAELIRSDVIRLKYKNTPGGGAKTPFLKGPYSTDVTTRVYKDMADQAGKLLKAGHTVILDAGFADLSQRELMRKLAERCNVRFALLLCEIPRELALSRLEMRRVEGKDVSDGRVELYDLQSDSFEKPREDEHALTVDTSLQPANAANIVLGRLSTNSR
jgi:aminoglycoside phosphotransferase family enzyme/predicted kinase